MVLAATSAALVLAAPAFALAEPAAGVWIWRIGTGPQGNDYKDIPFNVVAPAEGGVFDVMPAAAYQKGYCQFAVGEVFGHFVYKGLDVNKNRRYEGHWLDWKSWSDGTCEKKGLGSGVVTASLYDGRDEPDAVYGPINILGFYLGSYRMDQGVPSTAEWGFTRKSGTLPAVRITAIRSAGRPGKPVKLQYTVTFAAATVERVTVTRDGKAVWGAKGKPHPGSASVATKSFLWSAPKKPAGSYAFCVSGQPADASLGWSKPSCAPIRLR